MTSESNPSPRKPAKRNSWRGLLLAGFVGLAIVPVTAWVFPYAVVAKDLARGLPSTCDSASTWSSYRWGLVMQNELDRSNAEAQVVDQDSVFDILKVRTTDRPFWVPKGGTTFSGRDLIA